MTAFNVVIMPRAESDLLCISDWLAQRSLKGASNWIVAFELALARLRSEPRMFGDAPEAAPLGQPLQQILFKTQSGRRYRAIFKVEENDVYLLRVRGPGQPALRRDEIS